MGRRRARKRPYPRRADIAEAILAVLASEPYLHPDELVEKVKAKLEENGFYSGLVNAKRVWRVYAEYVKAGRLHDYLNVLRYGKEEDPSELLGE